MTHPYKNKPDHQFWHKTVAWEGPGQLDPFVTKPKFVIRPRSRVATMGSCFAQHISRELLKQGFNFFDAEPAPDQLSFEEARQLGYGIFSARYGNVYTVRQALQMLDRAFVDEKKQQSIWESTQAGRFVDAFRPNVVAGGFDSKADIVRDRARHYGAVRKLLSKADVLVFTLGLTETWMDRRTGFVYPVAPGVVGGQFDARKYQFVNFTVGEVIADLHELVARLKEINSNLRILLTVSPVPLVATYENQHVLVSNTLSKSILRVAAAEVCKQHGHVEYFPSYELITAPDHWGKYLEDDMRSVRPEGVAHVMRVFKRHLLLDRRAQVGAGVHKSNPPTVNGSSQLSDVVCEEELITESLKKSGF